MSSPLVAFALTLAAAGRVFAAPRSARALPPAQYEANPAVGPGGDVFTDSDHFRIYNRQGADADDALRMLETAYSCYVENLGFRSSGLSFHDTANDGPWTKTNIYSVNDLGGPAGVQRTDTGAGAAYLDVVNQWLTNPDVTVHEFGHALHYHQRTWVNQGRTGAWWESFANWVADTSLSSDLCASARAENGVDTRGSIINVYKNIGDSWRIIVDGSANYYEAWPFFTYLTSNPDNIQGLGRDTLRRLQTEYAENSDETPLHTLQRVAGDIPVADIVGRYWAHMAYVDIGQPRAHQVFLDNRGNLNYNNVQSTGEGVYTVIPERRPQYMGANIIPLSTTGGTVNVQITANGQYSATFATMSPNGHRYVDVDSSGSIDVGEGEELSLVIANTPQDLILYNPFALGDAEKWGLDYSFTLSGATVSTRAV